MKIVCIKCRLSKLIKEFYKNKNSKDEVLHICKKCFRSADNQNKDKTRFGGNREIVFKRDNYCCVKCGMTNEDHLILFKRDITIDHIDGNGRYSEIPNNKLSNLQTLCLSCHGKKDIKRRVY